MTHYGQKFCGIDRQTLRDWVIRYNEHGMAGLSDLPRRGGWSPGNRQVAVFVRPG